MNEKRYKLALAGLLHDIGKFAQRVDVGISRTWNQEAQEDYKYKHALMSHDFVKKFVPWDLQHWVGNHHVPTSPEERIIHLADQLSSGERSNRTHPQDEDTRRVHPKQLRSIFSSLTITDQTVPQKVYYPLEKLKLDRQVIFPEKAEEDLDRVWRAYRALWDQFISEVETLKTIRDLPAYLENMLELIRQYAWNIPSAYWDAVPDISLYDHNRMTAALAVCLADCSDSKIANIQKARHDKYKNDELNATQRKLIQEDPLALLVGGDLSGVQDFIYSLTSKRAAKTLRGRSFYLQLLTEAILRYVLTQLDLPYTNVIYSGGGHFYLLVPPSLADKLAKIKPTITKKLHTYHKTGLYLAIGQAEVPAAGFEVGQFQRYWTRMHSSIAKVKRQRYAELGDQLYASIFKPPQHGGNEEKTCSVCGREQEGTQEREDKVRVCPMCWSFSEQIGAELPNSKFVVLGLGGTDRVSEVRSKQDALRVLRSFGMEVGWGATDSASEAVNLPHNEGLKRAVIWALDDTEKFPRVAPNLPTVQSTRYTVNMVPKKDDHLMTFDRIITNYAKGMDRLGVLRMDIDNLGKIFKYGFASSDHHSQPVDITTLARLSTLSFQVSLFFEGWIKRICQREQYENSIYAVYAGGDDVFLIGPWNLMPALALNITTDLAEYTGRHPGIHISGGMSFIHGKYPLYQAAADAGEAESKAKEAPGKNAFHFLGATYHWEQFKTLEEKYKTLLELVGQDDRELKIRDEIGKPPLGGPNALIQTLRELAAEKEKHQKENQRLQWGPWIWHGVYRLRRMQERNQDKLEKFANGVEAIRKSLAEDDYEKIDQWAAAARWAQLRLRKSKNGEG